MADAVQHLCALPRKHTFPAVQVLASRGNAEDLLPVNVGAAAARKLAAKRKASNALDSVPQAEASGKTPTAAAPAASTVPAEAGALANGASTGGALSTGSAAETVLRPSSAAGGEHALIKDVTTGEGAAAASVPAVKPALATLGGSEGKPSQPPPVDGEPRGPDATAPAAPTSNGHAAAPATAPAMPPLVLPAAGNSAAGGLPAIALPVAGLAPLVAEPVVAASAAGPGQGAPALPNGDAAPKRKGGWPKGKPRRNYKPDKKVRLYMTMGPLLHGHYMHGLEPLVCT